MQPTGRIDSSQRTARPRPRSRPWLLGLAWLAAGVAGAQPTAAAPPDAPLVVATVGMIGDVAAEVAGECATVSVLMGPGSDPHLYRPGAGDVRQLGRADLVLFGGLHLEAGLAQVLGGFSDQKPTVAVSELAVPAEQRLAAVAGRSTASATDGAATGQAPATALYDPHVWMDVSLWSGAVTSIAQAIVEHTELAPGCAEAIRQRAQDYVETLAALHAWAGQALASIPERQRILITAHDAFEYFGRAYGIEVEGVQGISTETEAAVADIRRVAGIVVERAVPAVFVESTINPRTVTAVLEAVRQRGGQVVIGDQLYADALGSLGTPEGTYIGMVVHNVSAIADALGGEVPPLPPALQAWEARW